MTAITTASTNPALTKLSDALPETATTSGDTTQPLGNPFGGLMSLLMASENQGSVEDINSSVTAETANPLIGIQKGLLAAVGLDGLDDTNLSQLGAENSISSMQNSLLASLQASLFNQANTSVESTNIQVENSLSDAASSYTSETFFSQFGNVADYSFGSDGLVADDLFDTINPLNHIPVVSDIYQSVTSTEVDPISDIVGGFAFGGPMGLGYAAINLAVEGYTGKSMYSHFTDYFFDTQAQEIVESESSKVSDTISQANQAYQFVSRTF